MVECGVLVLLVKQPKGGAWFRGFKKATSRQSDHTPTHTHIHPSHPTVHCVCTLHTLTITHIYHIIHVLTWPGSMSAAAVMPGSCPPKRADAIRTQTRHRMAHCLYNRLLVRSIYARFVRAPGWCARAASLCGDRSATKTVVVVCIRPLHQVEACAHPAQIINRARPPTGPTCSLSCMVRSGRGGRQGQKRRRRPGGGSGGRGGAGGNGGCGAGSRAHEAKHEAQATNSETKLLSSTE